MFKANRFLAIIVLLLFVVCIISCGGGGSSESLESAPPAVSAVSIAYPSQDQLIDGDGVTTAEIQVSVSDNAEINKAELFIDGKLAATAESEPENNVYKIDFNADELAEGTHTLKAQATDSSGNVSSAEIAVRIDRAILRKLALEYLTDYNTLNGCFSGVRRWASLPIVIEVSAEIVQDGYLPAYQKAANFWTRYTGITFQVIPSTESYVDPMTGKEGVIFCEYGDTSGNGAAIWTNVDLETMAHIASIMTIADEYDYAQKATLIAHEIGHSLGIWTEVNDGTITDHYSYNWRMSPVTAVAMRILYFELSPGEAVPEF